QPECFWVNFFFSSRRRHTSFSRDWSSDVCSSDLQQFTGDGASWYVPCPECRWPMHVHGALLRCRYPQHSGTFQIKAFGSQIDARSEERRVGKECRCRWSRCNEKEENET